MLIIKSRFMCPQIKDDLIRGRSSVHPDSTGSYRSCDFLQKLSIVVELLEIEAARVGVAMVAERYNIIDREGPDEIA